MQGPCVDAMSKDGVDGLSDFEKVHGHVGAHATLIDTFSISIRIRSFHSSRRVGATKSQQGIVFSLFPLAKSSGRLHSAT